MTLAIVFVCVALYLGLAVAVGRFCGINSAWDRVIDTAMAQGSLSKQSTSGLHPMGALAEDEGGEEEAACRSEEEETAAQPV